MTISRSLAGLLAFAALSEAIYLSLTQRYGLWAARLFDLTYLWLYSALGLAFLGACVLLWRARGLDRRATVVVVGAAVVFRLTLLPQPVIFCEDIFRYIWDGRVLSAGVNPYLYPPAAAELASLAVPTLAKVTSPQVNTPYQPLAETFFAALYLLWPADIVALKAALALFDLATVGVLMLLLRELGQSPALVLVYAWNPLPVTEFAGHGHVDAVGVFFLSLALLLMLRGRSAAATAVLGLAGLVKVLPLVLAPLWLLRGGWRASAALVVVLGLGFLPFLEAGDRLFSGLGAMAERWEANASAYFWVTSAAASLHLLAEPGPPVRAFLSGLALLAALAIALRAGRSPLGQLAGAFWTLAVLLLASPFLFPWYIVCTLPCLTVLLSAPGARRLRPAYVSWLLFCCTAGLYYHFYLTNAMPDWVRLVEYLPAYLALGLGGYLAWRPRVGGDSSSVAAPPPAELAPARVGVVIPTFNEAQAIGPVLRAIPPQYAANVLVVDGGSSDGTAELARAAGARVVLERRRGYGRACATGAERLEDCEIVVFLDGDHSDYPEEMPSLVRPIVAGEADLVVGSRLRGRREPGALPLHSLAGNWLAALLMRLLYGLPVTDLGPFRAIRCRSLRALGMTEMTYGWPVEMLAKAARAGLRVQEVPVSYRPRLGRSKITGTLRGSLLASYFILSRVFCYVFTAPGPVPAPEDESGGESAWTA
ncbi:MAG: glycosyltransferase [Chloroflexota bacterium]